MGNYKGKNVDEAIENGLAELNLKKSEVKINIIDHGNAGIQCLKRIFELDLLAFKYNLAGCRRMNAD